ncbi:MAG: glucose-6-phosphate isomerase [Clostridia bacterium]|nr:glucose-6-phosphate isomerase [Clostridia bacterium]
MGILSLNEAFAKPFVKDEEMQAVRKEAIAAYGTLCGRNGEGSDFLGWMDLPENYDKEEFERILAAAEKIKKSCDILVVIGIGGSYLGARAVIEFLRSPLYNNLKKDTPDIYFAGNTISAAALSELFSICEGKDVCINVISKSGTTTEPAVAFRAFRGFLEEKYGKEGAKERIFVTTDREKGALKKLSAERGYETFVVPDDIGGRFSVLSAVGLLPIAVTGIDISALMNGAALARKELLNDDFDNNPALRYVAYRNIFHRQGKSVEMLVGYEPYLQMLNEWWKQLYGESEGKDGKGLLPDSVIFSTDLHSLGQFVQDGSPILFETVLFIKNSGASFLIPNDEENIDGLNFLTGKQLDYVNEQAMKGTLLAHTDGNVPNLVLELEERNEKALGYLLYFFELACAVSGYLLGVNPFNQPGVESYKKNMFALLGKPGYEAEKEKLTKRLK